MKTLGSIIVRARLHITLLAMHLAEYRMNGGLGFAIDKLSAKIEFAVSENMSLADLRIRPLEIHEQNRLSELLIEEQKRYAFQHSIKLNITGLMVGHSGFGSGTAITLACLEALHIVNNHPVSKEALIKSSKRGGTSGIGIYTYFNGGLVFDLGRPADNTAHRPSHEVKEFISKPLLLSQFPMPDWEIGVCIPRNISTKSQEEEREFFHKICPITTESVHEVTYHALFGLFAAAKENNKLVFCSALKAVQDCAWKRLERNEYGQALQDIEKMLYSCGAQAVGMSSFGPSLFFLADDMSMVMESIRREELDCDFLVAKPINSGREIF